MRFDTSSLDNVAAGNETTVRITDNDTRGVTVTPAVLTVDEGFSDSYEVVLTSKPTSDVTVAITVPAGSDITVDHAALTFTTSNWRQPQPVTVSAANDDRRTPRTTRGPSPTSSAAATTVRSVLTPSPSRSMTMKSVSASNARHTRPRKAATPSRSRSVSAPPPSKGSRSAWSRPTRATPPRTTTPLCPTGWSSLPATPSNRSASARLRTLRMMTARACCSGSPCCQRA